MFTNLIESSAHRREFKRRSSFFLATVAGYSLILFTAGIVGILTYDAQVEAQTTDLILGSWVPAVKHDEPDKPRDRAAVRKPRTANAPVDRNVRQSIRTDAVAGADDPTKVPDNPGVERSSAPPPTGPYKIGDRNVDPESVTPDKSACVSCSSTPPKVVESDTGPLPPKPEKRTMIRVSEGVMRGNIVELPKPTYPILAIKARIQGLVNVQILVDETGRVVSAQAVKGSPMLTRAAEDAARRARFTPTKLGNDPVKVQGVITYNFVLQ